MATLNINIPDSVEQFVATKVAQGGYSTPSEFIVDVLQLFQQRDGIEQKLLAAIDNNDFEEVTPALWDRLRERASQGSGNHGSS